MSLSSFGGVLVDTPNDLSVQSLLATHSSLLSPTAFLPGPTTEITLDEDDVFQCGRCKEIFTSFHQFMLHKQEHQIATSTSERLNDSLTLDINPDLNRTLNSTASAEHEAEACISNTQLLKDACCEQFTLSQSLRVGGCRHTNNVLDYSALGSTSFEDLSDEIGQPLMINGTDTLNFPIEQSILNLSNSTELSSGSFVPTAIPDLEPSLISHKLLCNEDCTSNNNVWMTAQKNDNSNSNFITSGFPDEQNFFIDNSDKKVSHNINFSNSSLLTEISYPGEKQMYLNETPTNAEEITVSGNVSTSVLPSEQMLLQTSKDYLSSCELLEEFESTNQHGLLDSASLESANVLEIEMPLISDSQMEASLVNNTSLHTKVSSLLNQQVEQDCNTLAQDCHMFQHNANVIQGGCSILGPEQCATMRQNCNILMHHCTSLQTECSIQGHDCNATACNSLDPECNLLVNGCNALGECSSLEAECNVFRTSCHASLGNCSMTISQEHSGNEEPVDSCDVNLEQACSALAQESLSVKENKSVGNETVPTTCNSVDQECQTKEQECQAIEDCAASQVYMGQDLLSRQHNQGSSTDDLDCDTLGEVNQLSAEYSSASEEDIYPNSNALRDDSFTEIEGRKGEDFHALKNISSLCLQDSILQDKMKIVEPEQSKLVLLVEKASSPQHRNDSLIKVKSAIEQNKSKSNYKVDKKNRDFNREEMSNTTLNEDCIILKMKEDVIEKNTSNGTSVECINLNCGNPQIVLKNDDIFHKQMRSHCDHNTGSTFRKCSQSEPENSNFIDGDVNFVGLDPQAVLKTCDDGGSNICLHNSDDLNKNADDTLWFCTLDHDYQLVHKNGSITRDSGAVSSTSTYDGDQKGRDNFGLKASDSENVFSEIEPITAVEKQGGHCIKSPCNSEINGSALKCRDSLSKLSEGATNADNSVSKLYDADTSTHSKLVFNSEPQGLDCDVSESCNTSIDCKYNNCDTDVMPTELFNETPHSGNILIELDCDSMQSDVIFIDHGNFVGEQEIISAGLHNDSEDDIKPTECKERFSYLDSITNEDDVTLSASSSWCKENNSGVMDESGSGSLNGHKVTGSGNTKIPTSLSEAIFDTCSSKRHVSEDVSHAQSECNVSSDLIGSSSNCDMNEEKRTFIEEKIFGCLCDPPGDLFDSVSVVYSAYEEESTTFSKLWNPDIRVANEAIHDKSGAYALKEHAVGPRRSSAPSKRKASKLSSKPKLAKIGKVVPVHINLPSIQARQKRSSILLKAKSSVLERETQPSILRVPAQVALPTSARNPGSEIGVKAISMQQKPSIMNLNRSRSTKEMLSAEEELMRKTTSSLKSGKMTKWAKISIVPKTETHSKSQSSIGPENHKANSVHNILDRNAVNCFPSKEMISHLATEPRSCSSPPSRELLNSIQTKTKKESLWEPRTPKLTCEYCNKRFVKLFDLRQHLRSHTGEKPFQCVVCSRSFAQKSNLTKHIQTHKIWSKSVFSISKNAVQKICHKKKPGEDSVMVEEKQFVKQGTPIASMDKEFESVYTQAILYNKKDQENQMDENEWEVVSEECIVDKSYLCQFCGASFVTYFELKSHRKDHQDEKVFFCNRNDCQKTFPDLESFVEHVNKHAPEGTSHLCNICGQTFTCLTEFTHHKETHTPEMSSSKKYLAKCPKCKSNFSSQEALDNHLRTVSHDLPCPECKRIFSCERSLRRHLTSHSTVYPFVCKECGKRFKTLLYLNTHLAMHRDDKPFACSHCPAKFARKDRLSRHLLIHSEGEKLKCPFHTHLMCNREFVRRDKLKVHVMSHIEHKLSNCIFCRKQLAKFSVNKRHYPSSFPHAEDSSDQIQKLSTDENQCYESFGGVAFRKGDAATETDSKVVMNDKNNTSLSLNGSINLGMSEDKCSVGIINNLSCENVVKRLIA